MAHKTRDLLVKQRTMLVNCLRGLAHFRDQLVAVETLIGQLQRLDEAIADLTRKIIKAQQNNGLVRLLKAIPGIGDLSASLIAATVADPHMFQSGRDFSAWLGLTPRQNSTGGKTKLLGISKKGNHGLRRLLFLGALTLLRVAHRHTGALGDWLRALKARKCAKVVAIAVANKLARIIWAMMTRGETFRAAAFARA